MKLFGSQTSPYVRRIRLLLKDHPYELVKLNISELKDRKILKQVSPILKIPVLQDENTIIWDSRQIFRYLQQKGFHSELTWEEENFLTAIDAINDSLIQLFLLEKNGLTPVELKNYHSANHERVLESLHFLETETSKNSFSSWSYPSISLYSLIDWIQFRERQDLSRFENLLRWFNDSQTQQDPKLLKLTDPRF